jgi:hypothetical protein
MDGADAEAKVAGRLRGVQKSGRPVLLGGRPKLLRPVGMQESPHIVRDAEGACQCCELLCDRALVETSGAVLFMGAQMGQRLSDTCQRRCS